MHEEDLYKNIPGPEYYAKFAFVQGCVWGDDTSWKLTVFDISKADKGILKEVRYISDEDLDDKWKRKPDTKDYIFYEQLWCGKLKDLLKFDDLNHDNEEEIKEMKRMQFEFKHVKTARLFTDKESIMFS